MSHEFMSELRGEQRSCMTDPAKRQLLIEEIPDNQLFVEKTVY